MLLLTAIVILISIGITASIISYNSPVITDAAQIMIAVIVIINSSGGTRTKKKEEEIMIVVDGQLQ